MPMTLSRFVITSAGLLSLLSGLSAEGLVNDANAQVVALPTDRVVARGYGWGYGTNRHRTRLSTTFTSSGNDLLLHAQGYDIEKFNDVVIHINGRRLGALHPGRHRAFSNGALWFVPSGFQSPGRNTITFTRRGGDAQWGVRNIGLLRPGSSAASLGFLKSQSGGDRTHPRVVRLYLPDSTDRRTVTARFYDVDNIGEVSVATSEGAAGSAPTSSNNRYSGGRSYDVAARNAWIDFRNNVSSSQNWNWGVRISAVTETFSPSDLAGFQPISSSDWDDAAVRRVLHTFAFGSHATEQQIRRWAAMAPDSAIVEILNFKQHNLKLSPPTPTDRDRLATSYASLSNLRKVMLSSPDLPYGARWLFRDDWAIGRSWTALASARGLNPFLHRVVQWETNYHMAINRNVGVNTDQITRYYDDIMKQLERNVPYENVMSTAAASAAIAMQYKHNESIWDPEEQFCECNEDFAREYYQLFFGVLGEYGPDHHEKITIKNMSKVLTDIDVSWSDQLRDYPSVPRYGSRYHYRAPLELWPGYTSPGASNAKTRIQAISREAINLQESLDNLPVKIISGLADDNLDTGKIAAIRAAWASMPSKNLLKFLRAYAISTTFHNPTRIKFWNSLERRMFINTGTRVTNKELWFANNYVNAAEYEGYNVFKPKHNVFGGQRGAEASRSPEIFRSVYNRASDDYWEYTYDIDYDGGKRWEKNWARTLPRDADGKHRVRRVAEYLWNRIIGDGLNNFGRVERGFVYALLGSDNDLLWLLDPDDINRVITPSEATSDSRIVSLTNQLATRVVNAGSPNRGVREEANYRIGRAVAFISATPYAFAQEGK